MSDSSAVPKLDRASLRALATAEASALADRLADFADSVLSAESAARQAEAREAIEQHKGENERLCRLVADLQRDVETLSAALEAERARAMEARLQAEKAEFARANADQAWEQSEEARHRDAVAFERKLRDARADLEVRFSQITRLTGERDRNAAECTRLASALEAIETALALAEDERDSLLAARDAPTASLPASLALAAPPPSNVLGFAGDLSSASTDRMAAVATRDRSESSGNPVGEAHREPSPPR